MGGGDYYNSNVVNQMCLVLNEIREIKEIQKEFFLTISGPFS